MAGSDRPFGLTAPLGTWRPLDRWVAGYALLTATILTAFALRGAPGAGRQALGSLGVLVLATLLGRWTRDTRNPILTILRLFYMPLFYTFFYRQIHALWPLFHRVPLDGYLAHLEWRLFGTQPSLAFQAAFPYRWLSEVFCFAYFSYYFFTPLVGLTALFRRGYLAAERILLATTICFLACYTFFWLVPTVAPHFWFAPHLGPQLYHGYVFNHLLFLFTANGEIPGGAFPSSHLAVAVLLTLWARRETPGLFPYLAVITTLMLPAVVYLGAHYLLDVPTGVLTGVLAYHFTKPRHAGL